MGLQVVGSGFGRTGTHSLKIALEKLLGAPCYHMVEVFRHPEHVPAWHRAANGDMPDWNDLLDGYASAVDWPSAAYWRELAEAYPDALILHSTRDPESWWASASHTIFQGIPNMEKESPEWFAMVKAMLDGSFTSDLSDKDACIAAFERHNRSVLETAPKDRLIVWQAGEGWEPICVALGVPVPDEPFPRTNTKEEFIARMESRNSPPSSE